MFVLFKISLLRHCSDKKKAIVTHNDMCNDVTRAERRFHSGYLSGIT